MNHAGQWGDAKRTFSKREVYQYQGGDLKNDADIIEGVLPLHFKQKSDILGESRSTQLR